MCQSVSACCCHLTLSLPCQQATTNNSTTTTALQYLHHHLIATEIESLTIHKSRLSCSGRTLVVYKRLWALEITGFRVEFSTRALEFDLNLVLVLCIIWQLLLRSFRQFLIFDPSDPLDWRDEPGRCYWSWHDMLLGRTPLLLSPIEWDELVCSGSRVISSGSTNGKWISTQHLFQH